MNDLITKDGGWPTWLQQTVWLEWLYAFLYVLLVIAVVSLVIALLDLAMLCWKEFHATEAPKTNKARTIADSRRDGCAAEPCAGRRWATARSAFCQFLFLR